MAYLNPEQRKALLEVIYSVAKAVANDATADPNESWIGETTAAIEEAEQKLEELFG